MFDASWSREALEEFRGAVLKTEEGDAPRTGALLTHNVRFIPGSLRVRPGFKAMPAVSPAISKIVTAMFNFQFSTSGSPNKRLLLVWNDTDDRAEEIDLAGLTSTTLWSESGAYAAIFRNAGVRAYACHFDTNVIGVGHARVYQPGVGYDKLFRRPMLTTEVTVGTALGAGGDLTEGTRRIGFVIQDRMGFLGRPSPALSGALVFSPTTLTSTAANRTATITLTPATVWPTGESGSGGSHTIYLVATTTRNLADYRIIRSSSITVPPGWAFPVNLTFSMSDNSILLNTDSALDLFSQLTQTESGNAPFSPIGIVEAGNRMGYLTTECAYFSEPNNFQSISQDQHVIFLPGQKQICAGAYHNKEIYISGPNGTFAFTDSGNKPVLWPQPRTVDENIGTLSPRGMSATDASRVLWIADVRGLYCLQGGSFDSRPASYYQQPDWDRIDWSQPAKVSVTDHPSEQSVIVTAPLKISSVVNVSGTTVTRVSGDKFTRSLVSGTAVTVNGSGNTVASVTDDNTLVLGSGAGTLAAVTLTCSPTYPTHMLRWDYQDGYSAEQVRYTLDYLKDANPACTATVMNATTRTRELWMGMAQAGEIRRTLDSRVDSSPYVDGSSTGILGKYKSPRMPSRVTGLQQRHHGLKARLLGSGVVTITAYGMDDSSSKVLSSVTLTTLPGKNYQRTFHMISEMMSYLFETDGNAGSYFQVGFLEHYYSPWLLQR